jgi:hypothetical protein
MPKASRTHGDRTVRTGVFAAFFALGFRLRFRGAAFFEGRERDPLPPDLREGEVFVAMCGQA